MSQVIIVGGGLAGVSAAHTALQKGCNVVLIDKNAFLGGNSTKATSGINGAGTRSQKASGIHDTAEIFEEDTVRSATGLKKPGDNWAAHKYPLAKIIAHNSAPAVHWLQDSFDLGLDKVARLGGHSNERTHRTGIGGKFPGMEITYRLIERLEKVCKDTPERARILVKSRVNKLISDSNGNVTGVEYVTRKGVKGSESGTVVICSGGYAAGALYPDSILRKIRPDLMGLSTTNGKHCTGDALVFSESVNAAGVDLEHVQVHPTGLINPKMPNAKTLFLAAEALRGSGGILLDRDGNRFVDELNTRDYVSGVMQKHNKYPYRLVLNNEATNNIAWHCKHYTGRGVMKNMTGADLAKEIGVSSSHLQAQFDKYNAGALIKKDEYKRKYFKGTPFHVSDDNYHVAIVTPVVHYCMGGIQIDENSQIVNKSGKPIGGYFAAGEVTGGVHGKNRLGGSALLECVVFGRLAGDSAADYALNGGSSGSSSAGSGGKVYTMEEVGKHNTEEDCWVVVNGQVLDVTAFMEDHPGGAMAIFTFAGKDASEEFNMLHERNVVEKYAPECVIGTVAARTSKL